MKKYLGPIIASAVILVVTALLVYGQSSSPPQPGWFPTVSQSGITVWTRDGSSLTNLQVSGGSISNVTTLITTNFYSSNAYITNITVNNLNVDVVSNFEDINITTNVIFQQNISVSGKATFNNITVTNQLQFTTNAFPLVAGSTWDLTKPYQEIITNQSFNITALGGITNNQVNWGVLVVSNSGASSITVGLNFAISTGGNIGPSTTNSLIIPSTMQGVNSVMVWGNKKTNICNQVGH